ncbi:MULTISPECIES: type IV toxin-antitoxin system AbiEi family antitoxin domain-containing protein [Gordonia]|uniref:type IV toxin-antitoxin system AbiEi family antitoxin domain-containing protein n=1 Tax=Gordonia TaxID=2053 RepID=UPI0009ABFB87|nr:MULTISPECIES: hypothetical protein [Gordonia]MBE7192432.1 hypothetical protein [Gordonia polyisoprenivorans]MDF3282408.1 hypothetical protein [Gordonia sp. N1V]OPX14159.1 hypothetical protein B1964_16720 [Gordonia sp. i37]UZF54808.1 hypothetical protein LH935_19035 [Gordonia polyisoprenivorans]WCB35992.1 hypothetical protein PHA63_18130 [Gordonia polyisoprenivorans]
MMTFPADTHGLIHRASVIAVGLTDEDLARAVRTKQIVRIVRGVYAEAVRREPEELHRLTAIATVLTGTSDAPLSHQSAAAVHGLAMLEPNFRRVHRTAPTGFRTTTLHCHVGEVSEAHTVVIDGVSVTSLERTAVDVACGADGFARALAVFDAALRRGADREVMAMMLAGSRRGVGRARHALRFADGNAESPGESWSRAQLIEAGLRPARLQHEFYDKHGIFVARTDFDWDGLLVGEFDGKVKYQKLLRPGEDVTEVVLREKAREDALRAMGIMVIRWVWDDLRRGTVVAKVRHWLVHLALMAA